MALEKLKDAIEHATNVQQGAIVLIKDLADKLNSMAQHPDAEEIRRLAAELRQRADELAGAIAEHADEDDGDDTPAEGVTRRKR